MKALGQGFHLRVFYNQLKSKHFSFKKKKQAEEITILKRTNYKSWEIKTQLSKFFKWMGAGSVPSRLDRVLLDRKIKLDIGALEAL